MCVAARHDKKRRKSSEEVRVANCRWEDQSVLLIYCGCDIYSRFVALQSEDGMRYNGGQGMMSGELHDDSSVVIIPVKKP